MSSVAYPGSSENPETAPTSLDECSELVGDDIEYWLHNPFMGPGLLGSKITAWINAAFTAGTEAAEAKLERVEALTVLWDEKAEHNEAAAANCESRADRHRVRKLAQHQRMFAHALRSVLSYQWHTADGTVVIDPREITIVRAADEAYDRLHGLDGHTQAVTHRYTPRQYDPDHCTACGDDLPCGESWLKVNG